MIKNVIFDLDGTLIDTEKYFRIFWRKAAEQNGYEMSDEQALALRSLGRPFAPALMKEWFGEDFDYYAVREVRRKLMKAHLDKVGLEVKPGAGEALKWLKENGYTVALATATPTERAAEQLKEVNLYPFFTRLVSAVQVERGKPAPDVYLHAAKELGADPAECLAVEDSPNGVLSALAAGMKVVMVPDQTQPDKELKEKLYACIENLGELKEVINRLS